MPFTTEDAVRLTFQLLDATLAPQALVLDCINRAHTMLLRSLEPLPDPESAPEAVVYGETLLAGARVCESLAASHAVTQKSITIGGQRIEPGDRFRALLALAALCERQAWETLEPHLRPLSPVLPATTTESAPILNR